MPAVHLTRTSRGSEANERIHEYHNGKPGATQEGLACFKHEGRCASLKYIHVFLFGGAAVCLTFSKGLDLTPINASAKPDGNAYLLFLL